jgi:hypothetical protein
MANAAAALADFLEAHGLPAGIGSDTDPRAGVDPRGMTSWDVDEQAAANLMEVERVLNRLRAGGEDMAMFRGCLSTWFEGVVTFRTADGMQEAGPRVPVPAERIRPLRVLGVLMDAQGPMTLEQARAVIDGARADR